MIQRDLEVGDQKTRKAGGSKSAVGQHQVKTEHVVISKPMIEGVSVIDNEPRNPCGKVKEAIYIELQRATLKQNSIV